MIYIIPTQDLLKIFNPFEKSIFKDSNDTVDSQEILDYIERGDIFHHQDDSVAVSHIKKIAFEYINYEDKPLGMYRKDNSIVNETSYHDISDKEVFLDPVIANEFYLDKPHHYIASLLKNLPFIHLRASGLDYPTTHFEYHHEEVNHFKWISGKVEHHWEDTDYVIKQLRKAKNIHAITPFITPEVLKDPLFVTEFLKFGSIALKLCADTIKDPAFIDGIKHDKTIFYKLWKDYYHGIVKEDNKFYYDKAVHRYFTENIFNEPHHAIELLRENGDAYGLFPHEIKTHPEVVDYIINHKPYWVFSILDPSVYCDLQIFKKALATDSYNSSIAVCESWINDKERIIQLFEGGISPHITHYFQYLTKPLSHDKDILKLFLDVDSNVYQHFSKSQRTKDIVEHFLAIGGKPYLLESEAFKISDTATIKKIVESNSSLLSHENCPERWKQDDILLCAAKSLHDISLPAERMNKFVQDNIDYIKSVNPYLYPQVDSEHRKDPHWALSYLKQGIRNSNKSIHYSSIPPSVWANRDFCLGALQASTASMQHVPIDFFSDKKFIRSFFEKIDQAKIANEVLSYLPEDIQQILNEHEIKNNYSKFIQDFVFINSLEHELVAKADTKKIKI